MNWSVLLAAVLAWIGGFLVGYANGKEGKK